VRINWLGQSLKGHTLKQKSGTWPLFLFLLFR
jgi:hypothetical protein